jgi:hypothetical protein
MEQFDAFWEGGNLSQTLGNNIKIRTVGIYIDTLIICQRITGCTIDGTRRRGDCNGVGP